MEATSLIILWLASHLIAWPLLYETFGFNQPIPFVGVLLPPLSWPAEVLFTPFVSATQRRFEREADVFVSVSPGGRPRSWAPLRGWPGTTWPTFTPIPYTPGFITPIPRCRKNRPAADFGTQENVLIFTQG